MRSFAPQPNGERSTTATRVSVWQWCYALGFVLFFVILVVGKIGARDGWEFLDEEVSLYQKLGFMVFLLLAAPWLFFSFLDGKLQGAWTFGHTLFFGACFLSMLGASAPSQVVIYTFATATCAVALGGYWLLSPEMRRWSARAVAITYIGLLLFCFFQYGIGTGRFVGKMTPNHFANIALVSILMSHEQQRIVKWLIWTIALGLSLLVNSRGALLGACVFVVTWHLTKALYEKREKRLHVWIIVSGLGISSVLTSILYEPAKSLIFEKVLLIDDGERGINTGVTGRFDKWEDTIEAVAESPIVGQGFRSSKRRGEFETSHNAYLDLLKETGIIGVLAFGLLLTTKVRRLLNEASVISDIPSLSPSANVDTLSFLFAGVILMCVVALMEVHLVNIGFPLGLLMWLFLSRAHAAVVWLRPATARNAIQA